jgi:hypothetical protein
MKVLVNTVSMKASDNAGRDISDPNVTQRRSDRRGKWDSKVIYTAPKQLMP